MTDTPNCIRLGRCAPQLVRGDDCRNRQAQPTRELRVRCRDGACMAAFLSRKRRPDDLYLSAHLNYQQNRDYHSRASRGGIHETAQDSAAQSRDSCRHLIVSDLAGVRVRRLRSEPPSQCVGRVLVGRAKSKLVPENYGPHCRSYAKRNAALFQVIACGAARDRHFHSGRREPIACWDNVPLGAKATVGTFRQKVSYGS